MWGAGFHDRGDEMIGRRVKPTFSDEGEVVRWEPLGSGMCDVLVRHDDGREVWHASHTCKPVDGLGSLPSRQTAIEVARLQSLTQLQSIRDTHVKNFRGSYWAGCDWGRAHFGMMIDAAIADLKKGGTS